MTEDKTRTKEPYAQTSLTTGEEFASPHCFLTSPFFFASNLLSLTRLLDPNSLRTSAVYIYMCEEKKQVEIEKLKGCGEVSPTFEADEAVEMADEEGVFWAE